MSSGWAPGPATRLAGVVGHPVRHTLSPAIHHAALRHDGIDAVFLAFDVAPGDLAAFVEGMRVAGARGLSVTVPHKEGAASLADACSPEAERAGAANVLVLENDSVSGHNTDVTGVRAALGDLGAGDARRVLVIGAGGAARGSLLALDGAAELTLVNRTPRRAEELRARLAPDARVAAWSDLEREAARAELIIHTSSVGLDGASSVLDAPALRAAAEGGCRAVLDLVYGADETPLVRHARAAGLAAADGIGVLVYQAAAAYELFWGRTPDVGVMRRAVRSG